MKGHVINKSTMWLHAMKRAVAPGGKVPLDELYDQYGAKHDLAKGKEFISWLKTVKLRDTDKWQVISGKDVVESKPEDTTLKEVEVDITKVNPKKLTIEEVVSLSVRKAREIIPKVSDVKLLRYSLSEANPRPGKDSLCRILRKRITELETIRR